MSPADGLLRDVIEHPDEDGPRLIFADWLEEHGDPARAEFIRLQCELARADEERAEVLWAKAGELLKEHRERWVAPLKLPANVVGFHRGFPHWLKLSLADLLPRADELFAAAPLRGLSLADAEEENSGEVHALAECPHLARLEWLDFYSYESGVGPGGLRALLTSPHLTGLKGLTLGDADATPAVAEALADTPPRCTLTTLRLWGFMEADLGDAGAARLAETPHLGGLSELDLMHVQLGSRGAEALASSPHLTRLTRLSLGRAECGYTHNAIRAGGARALAGSPDLRGLTHLGLDFNHLGDEGLAALAHSPHLGGLRSLSLAQNSLGSGAVRELLRSPHLDGLRRLHLEINNLSESQQQALRERFGDRVVFSAGLRATKAPLW
jgi:uncharacterized protein (TIGR02996 family)